MERVLGHVDVDEMYLDVDPENLPDKGEIVETAHFFVGPCRRKRIRRHGDAHQLHDHVFERAAAGIC